MNSSEFSQGVWSWCSPQCRGSVVPEQACPQGVVERVFLASVFPQLHSDSSEMCELIEARYCLAFQTNQCLHIHLSIYYSKVLF